MPTIKNSELIDWTTQAGYRAVILKTTTGHNCGYVGVNYKHPLWRKTYTQRVKCLSRLSEKALNSPIGVKGVIPALFADKSKPSMDWIFDVHGSITFTGGGKGSEYPVKTNLWWIGFDCVHAGDTPEIQDCDYCKAECEKLAGQIKLVESK